MKIKRYAAYFIILLLFVSLASGNYTNAYGIDSVDRLNSLGVMNASGREYSSMTRGDFAQAIVNASGLQEEAASSVGTTIFSDVKSGSTLSGYVNVAVRKSLMQGMSDRKFHAETKMNFAQVCTLTLRALGYTDKDLAGTWPNNYINKANSLGLTEGVSLKKSDAVPLWVAASMIDNMLDANIKTSAGVDTSKTFADAAGLSQESYKYGLISNPVYSKPVIASGVTEDMTYIGNIYVSGQKIIKNGQSASLADIEDNDVVYQVSDALGSKKYILVIDDRVSGKITSLSSSQIQIDSKDYKFTSSFDYHKVLEDSDSLKTGGYATVLLGYDGKVVDYFDVGQQDNGDFAFVVNYSTNANNYSVKLLMIDGNTREYYTASNPSSYKGRLVKYTKTSGDVVSLSYVPYSSNSTYSISREERKIDNNYVSHNVKIFNLIQDNANDDNDSKVRLCSWYDFANTDIKSGQILHVNTVGTYKDVNIIVVNDLLNNERATGIVKEKTITTAKVPVANSYGGVSMVEVPEYNFSIVVNGTIKTYKCSYDAASVGQVLKVQLMNDNINAIDSSNISTIYGYSFEAADINRIRINNSNYYFDTNPVIYIKSSNGEYTLKNISDITIGKQYQLVSIYLDYSDNNKIAAIVITQ